MTRRVKYINLIYLDWPTSFFGIGNSAGLSVDDIDDLEEEYTSEVLRIQPWLVHQVYSHFSLGITYDLKKRCWIEIFCWVIGLNR
jgi:hypothetical protein